MAEEIEKRVHHYQRVIASGMPSDGSVSAEQVNIELSAWMEKGYRIQSAHFLGQLPKRLANWLVAYFHPTRAL